MNLTVPSPEHQRTTISLYIVLHPIISLPLILASINLYHVYLWRCGLINIRCISKSESMNRA